MLKIITENIEAEVKKILKRTTFGQFVKEQALVNKIIQAVAAEGDKALVRFTAQFDGIKLVQRAIAVDPFEIALAHSQADKKVLISLRMAVQNITKYNLRQIPKSWTMAAPAGSEVGLRYSPLESVGVYVPGGAAPYVSSVLMNVIPAKVAGVQRIALVTPPGKNGHINTYILAAAKELGITEVYAVGGAQAIAALALGTKIIPKVDKIVGPGNIYVTIAKQLVSGFCGIDKLAGPSDSVIIADGSAPAEFAAADLVTQAEHDELASSILITTSKSYALKVIKELETIVPKLSRSSVVKQSFKTRGAVFVVKDLAAAVKLSDQIAPEHLELMVRKPKELFNKVENAGAVFLGQYSPESLGDYFAGPNHVLPTGGTARFSSPLGVRDFVKATSMLYYTQAGLKQVSQDVARLALIESFDGHAAAIKARG